MKRLYIVFCLLVFSFVLSCHHIDGVICGGDDSLEEIVFYTDCSISAEVETKTSSVTSLSSFRVSCVTGIPGSETSVWSNNVFTGNNIDGYKYASSGRWWPATDPSYRFYASNALLNYSSEGATVYASNTTDVVCAYASSPSFGNRNTLSFEHIFARLGTFTVTADNGFTISNISITITPKASGIYNLRTGAGHVDGTGWSDVTTAGSASTIASALGSNSNDLYLIPGTYTLSASWTAEKELFREDISNMQCDVELVAGKVNVISAVLSGNTADLNVTLSSWNTEGRNIECMVFNPTFGGLEIAPAPLYYDGSSFTIKDDDWNHCSTSIRGKSSGSYHFTFVELGSFFDSRGEMAGGEGFTASSGDIDNNGNTVSYGGHDDWRLGTRAEWLTVTTGESPGESRVGATVNGASGCKYALIYLSGVSPYHAGAGTIRGLLLFPDYSSISGATLSGYNDNTYTNFNVSQLNTYLEQGCVFLPASGRYESSSFYYGGDRAFWSTATENGSTYFYNLFFYSKGFSMSGSLSKTTSYHCVRLVRDAN